MRKLKAVEWTNRDGHNSIKGRVDQFGNVYNKQELIARAKKKARQGTGSHNPFVLAIYDNASIEKYFYCRGSWKMESEGIY